MERDNLTEEYNLQRERTTSCLTQKNKEAFRESMLPARLSTRMSGIRNLNKVPPKTSAATASSLSRKKKWKSAPLSRSSCSLIRHQYHHWAPLLKLSGLPRLI